CALGGQKAAVTPMGRPEALKLTLPVKPFCGNTVTVVVSLVPGSMLKLPGDAERKKLGPDPGQLFTRLAMFTVPMPVEKSQPVFVPYAGLKVLLSVESTPTPPPPK